MSIIVQQNHDLDDQDFDLIDRLIEEWRLERPDLDPEPMAVVGRLFRIHRRMDSRLAEMLKPYGLRYSEFDVLATLLRSGAPNELTPTELQHAVILTSGAMTALLDRLTRQGLISRSRSSLDGRSKTARLTAKGKSLAEKLIKLRFSEAATNVDCLSEAQRAQLVKLLRIVETWMLQAP